MPRPISPPRLVLRQRGVNKYWYIKDRKREFGLKIPAADREAAEIALRSFLARGAVWRRRLKGHKRTQDEPTIGTIYFVRLLAPIDEQPIKIGYTSKDEARFHQIRTSSPWPLELIASVKAHHNTELALHEKCEEARMRGEWFRPSALVLEAVAAAQNNTLDEWLTLPCEPGFIGNHWRAKGNRVGQY